MEAHREMQFPDALAGKELPDILLPYQKELMAATAAHPVVICSKSRRIGATWGVGSDAVLTSAASRPAGGMDTFYIGYNLDMAREFIDCCAMWAKAFNHAAGDIDEFIFKDGDDREIQAFRIRFDSGFEIQALSSKPRSLRGRQGYIIIDEAAFHDDLDELMKAALAMLIWGGKVLVISTHNGVDNAFNQMIEDTRKGRNEYHLIQVDFDDALRDGLYRRICLVKGTEWSAEGERKWRQGIVKFYGSGADEELFCIPRKSGGIYFPGLLVENCMYDAPVIRIEQDDDFSKMPEFKRERIIEDWCQDVLRPLLDALDPDLRSAVGGDFARSGDLSVICPLQIQQDLVRKVPFMVEIRNMPFRQQLQILWYIMRRLPRFIAGAFDARGNGQQMSEETADEFGHGRIHQVMTTAAWYLEAFPQYKAGMEDGLSLIPRDADVLDDHRTAVQVNGIPQIPEKRKKGKDGGKRHGDALIASAMSYWATLQDTVEYGYDTPAAHDRTDDFMRPREDDNYRNHGKFGKGSW